MKTSSSGLGESRVLDGKGKGSADISENGGEEMCGKVGFRGPWKPPGDHRQVQDSPGLMLLILYLF